MESLPAEIIYNIYQLLDYTNYSNLKATSKYINISRPSLLSLHKQKFKETLNEIKSIKYYAGVYPQSSKDIGTYSVIEHGVSGSLIGIQLSCREYKDKSILTYYSSHKVKFSSGRMACMDTLTVSKNNSKLVNWNNKWNTSKNNKYIHHYYNSFYITNIDNIDIQYVRIPSRPSS